MSRAVSLALLCAAALALAAPAAASPRQTLTFEAPRELLGDAQREETLAELDALGVRALRVVLYWRSVAPAPDAAGRPVFDATDPAAYDWGPWDRLMAAAGARGWSVLLTVSGPVPRWATASRRDNLTRPSAREFQAFMTAAGRHYGGQVRAWSIWNEPNHPGFLRPQFSSRGRPLSPRIYRTLFQAAARGLRAAGQGDDTLLMGETAPRGTGSVVAPLTFLRGALCLSSGYRRSRRCARLPADGYAHHAYTTRSGPMFVPPGRNDVTIGVLGRLTRALDRAGRTGAIRRRMPVYLTEFGIQSTPDRLLGVSLAQQAEYLALSERIAYLNPRVRSFSQYLMRDDDPRAGAAARRYSGFESGLRFADGRAKPSYDAFRTPLAVKRRGRRVALWGRVRPAAGRTSVTVLYQPRRGARWRTLRRVRTDARGAWTARSAYRAGRRWRVRWVSPGGATYTGPPIRAYR